MRGAWTPSTRVVGNLRHQVPDSTKQKKPKRSWPLRPSNYEHSGVLGCLGDGVFKLSFGVHEQTLSRAHARNDVALLSDRS